MAIHTENIKLIDEISIKIAQLSVNTGLSIYEILSDKGLIMSLALQEKERLSKIVKS